MRYKHVRRARPILGTLVEISLTGRRESELHDAAAHAFAEIERVHDLMSLHSAGSDLFRLNNAPVGSHVQINARTWCVLELALDICHDSDGVFNVGVGGEMMARGDVPWMVSRLPDSKATFRDIELLPDRCVRFRRALVIDVGGIAKGYAVDSAVRVLQDHGVLAGCVNAGGDLRAFGDEVVTVQVRDPLDPSVARAHVDLRDRALATSANYANSHGFNAAGVVLDPRVGASVVSGRSASVRAQSCAVADALAKCVLVLGEASAPLLRRYRADAFMVASDECIVIDTHQPAGGESTADADVSGGTETYSCSVNAEKRGVSSGPGAVTP